MILINLTLTDSADHITRPVDPNAGQVPTSRAYAARPWATKGAQLGDDSVLNSRRNPRGRYMTISSSEPLKMEITPTLHSSAGDLILNRSVSFSHCYSLEVVDEDVKKSNKQTLKKKKFITVTFL